MDLEPMATGANAAAEPVAVPAPAATVADVATEAANGSASTAAPASGDFLTSSWCGVEGDGSASTAAPVRVNRGQFVRGDPRCNRRGRPRGSRKAAEDADPADLAPRAGDRLRQLLVPPERLRFGWVANLPASWEFAAARWDAARGCLRVTLRSKEFAPVAKGTPIPELVPQVKSAQPPPQGGPLRPPAEGVDGPGLRLLLYRLTGDAGWVMARDPAVTAYRLAGRELVLQLSRSAP
jgi:hypothetical protein